MTQDSHNARKTPRLMIDPDAIASRLEALDSTLLCSQCNLLVTPVIADAVALMIETIRLRNALGETRLESANRLASMLAALHAAADNESDPLAYLRYELTGDDAITGDVRWCR